MRSQARKQSKKRSGLTLAALAQPGLAGNPIELFPPRPRGAQGSENLEQRWQRCLARARPKVLLANQSRMEVARLALEATGGVENNLRTKKYTLKAFAGELGMRAKTLYDWCTVYARVFSKLPREAVADFDFEAAKRVRAQVEPEADNQDVSRRYRRERESSRDREQLLQAVKRMRTVRQNVVEDVDLAALVRTDRRLVDELRELCGDVTRAIDAVA
jgi:hypothetical protein